MLNEIRARETGMIKNGRLRKRVIRVEPLHLGAPSHQRLKHENVLHHVFTKQVEREQRMKKVIKDAHEQHDVEFLIKRGHIVNGQLAKFDVQSVHIGGKASLCQ